MKIVTRIWRYLSPHSDSFTTYEFCSHLEIEFSAFSLLVQFAPEEKWSDLIAESPELVEFCVKNYRNARSQSSRRTTNLRTEYSADTFLALLSALCAASPTVCSEFVRLRGLEELRVALHIDPNGTSSKGDSVYFEVLCASQILLQILLAENGRHVETVIADPKISKGVAHFAFLSF